MANSNHSSTTWAGSGLPNPGSAPVLVNLSGGIDSTYVAWQLLKRGHKVVLHHCIYKTKQNRWPRECEAVEAILNWFRANDLTNFSYEETTFDFGTISAKGTYDITTIGYMSGIVLHDERHADCKHVVISANRDDGTDGSPRSRARETLMKMASGRKAPINLVWPIKHMSKADVVKATPEDLLALCWYCRTPKNGKPCGECHTCKKVHSVKT